MANIDESKPDENIEDFGNEITICCPKCKSKDVELKESKKGYFWIYLCNNCGYQGKEGDSVGCLNKKESAKTEYD